MQFVNIKLNFQHLGTDYYAGEKVLVEEEEAEYFCAAGWAEDPEGKLKTLPPETEIRLQVKGSGHGTAAPAVGVK